jgi:hypothetical protein
MGKDWNMRTSEWLGTPGEGFVRHEVHRLGPEEWRVVARLRTTGGEHLLNARTYDTLAAAEAEYARRTSVTTGPERKHKHRRHAWSLARRAPTV